MNRGGSSGLRFAPGDFKYNGRITAALLPSLLVLAGFGGKMPVSIALVGAMVSYILDAIRYREGAMGAVWLTLGSVNLSLWFSEACFLGNRPFIMSAMIAIISGFLLFLTGIWATLQFKWVQMQYPVVVLAFEKLLLATAFTVAATMQTWGLVAAVGAAHAPFYLLIDLCILYHLLAVPLNTSFDVKSSRESAMGGRYNADLRVQSPLEAGVAGVLLTCLPGCLYALIHASVLTEHKHAWSVMLLFSAPCLYLSILKEGLWWLPASKDGQAAARQLLCVLSLAVFLASLEGRLIFPAFGQYIVLHPPWNYLLVTLALYGFAAIGIIMFSGMLSGAEQSTLAGTVLLVSALLGSFAAGVPFHVFPAPMFAAGGLALFLQSQDLKDYFWFVVGAACTTAWFIHHHFWFLEINLQDMSLQTFCKILWIVMLLALILPGLYIANVSKFPCSCLISVQVFLLSFLEEHLYIGVDEVEGEIYPAGMVLLTSSLGIMCCRQLARRDKLYRVGLALSASMLLAKASMLILPHARLPLPMFFVVLAVGGPQTNKIFALQIPREASKPVPPWWRVLTVAAVPLAILNARFAIYDLMHLSMGQRPSDGLLLGVLLISCGLGFIPALNSAFPGSRIVRRTVALVLAAGILIAVLRPPLPYNGFADCPGWLPESLCYRFWDAAHRPEEEEDDLNIWGEYGEHQSGWLLWMLVGAGLSMASSVTQAQVASRKPVRSLGPVLVSGVAVGTYIALEFFPGQLFVQVVVAVGMALLAAFIFGLRLRSLVSPRLLGLVLMLWAATFPVALLAESIIPLPPLPEGALRLFPDASILIEEQRQQSNRAALLAVYSAQLLLLAFTMKLRISSASAPTDHDALERNFSAAQILRMGNMYADSTANFLGQCLPASAPLQSRLKSMKVKGPMAAVLQQLEAEGLGWLPGASNATLLSCFTMSLILSRVLEQDSDTAIFVLAPMLLMLSQDNVLHGLTAKRRYLPVTAAISIYLVLSSVSQVLSLRSTRRTPAGSHTSQTVTFLKNLWLIGFGAPGHYNLNQYLWDRTPVAGFTSVAVMVLSILAAVFADVTVVKLLAVSGVLMSSIQYIAMAQLRSEGLSLI